MRKLTNLDAVSGGFVKEYAGGTYDVIDEKTNKVVDTTSNFKKALQIDMDINDTDTVDVKRFSGQNQIYSCFNGQCPDAPIDYVKPKIPLYIAGYNFGFQERNGF